VPTSVLSGYVKRSVGGDGSTSFACNDASCNSAGAITTTGTPTFAWLGDYNVGAPGTRTMNGILSRVCYQPDSPTRCR
jgi:hypothetical protein